MKKHRLAVLRLSVLILVIVYVILCVFYMDTPPLNVILPFGALALIIIIGTTLIVGFFWVAKNNMIMFEKNRICENERSMFFFDIMFGTCFQAIKKDKKFFFIKIGNGHFAIKEKKIYKDTQVFEEYIHGKKVKVIPMDGIRAIQLFEGQHPMDLATYNYDRYIFFGSDTFSKNLQSVFNAGAEELLNFFSLEEKGTTY